MCVSVFVCVCVCVSGNRCVCGSSFVPLLSEDNVGLQSSAGLWSHQLHTVYGLIPGSSLVLGLFDLLLFILIKIHYQHMSRSLKLSFDINSQSLDYNDCSNAE